MGGWPVARRTVEAFNLDTGSANKIHDDEVARRFGFAGGLVPGVEVYGYLSSLAAARWGAAWVAGGTMEARFGSPTYDGEVVEVLADEDGDGMALHLVGADGTVRATGHAGPPLDDPAPLLDRWPDVPQASPAPPASPEALNPGTAFGVEPQRFDAELHQRYLADVREDLPLYAEQGLAHPAWIVRQANKALYRNVRMGPWIHVGSTTRHHRAIADGQIVATRAVVTAEWEQKGHRFVRLDVAVLADGEVAAVVDHTAIYRPRQVAEA